MDAPVIYCSNDSPRLRYVLDWIFIQRFNCGYVLTKEFSANVALSYGKNSDSAVSIPDTGLLWEQDIREQLISTGTWEGITTLFADNNYTHHIPFDIFSAIFYLLSRYEEYFSFIPDKHGRYPAEDSILYQLSILEHPIVDEWLEKLRILLIVKGFNISGSKFSFIPTYDIDIAYSFKHKGWKRTIGGFVRDFLIGNTKGLSERSAAIFGNALDPYDSYDYLDNLHKKYELNPIYFILSAAKVSAFDKNIPLQHRSMKQLIERIAANATLGIHPSYYSDKQRELLSNEKSDLESIAGKKVTASRQHYIKFKIPYTYRQLISGGITDDYSMGYGTHMGFRAGTGSAFTWYDLDREQQTSLVVHPFSFMDTAAFYQQGLKCVDAFRRLGKMQKRLLDSNSTLITIFHNFSLGLDPEWNTWQEEYARFVDEAATIS